MGLMRARLIAFAIVMVLLLGACKSSDAVVCNAMALSPCSDAMFSPSKPKPSADCCSKLKEQAGCMCTYIKNPNLSKYIKTADAKRVAADCKLPFPKC